METSSVSPATSAATPTCEGMSASAGPHHRWLQQLLGDWTFESQCLGEPGQPSSTFRGREQVRALGDLWVVGEGEGEQPGGGTARMMLTLGFDPVRDRFVGTWIGSMMTHLWHYLGTLDAAEKVLTLRAEGPSFADPQKLAQYEDIIEIVAENHRTLTSRCRGEDGQWTQFMVAHYHRRT